MCMQKIKFCDQATTPENLPLGALGNCKIGTKLKTFRKKSKMGKKFSHTYKKKKVIEGLMLK